jgi:xanthine dehydrogenase accessory factor
VKLAFLDQLLTARREREPLAVVTDLAGGAQELVTHQRCVGELKLTKEELGLVHTAIDNDRSHLAKLPDRELFIEVWSLPLRLIIVGGVHIAQSLVSIARLTGFEVTLIDPREAFASPSRFPDTQLVHEWPDSAIPKLGPDRRTAIVTLTHSPRIDDPALVAALRSDAFYIGALGSRRTHDQRKARLAQEGVDLIVQGRIRAPVGLAIGASTPSEIAMSIVAEMIAALRSAPVGLRT